MRGSADNACISTAPTYGHQALAHAARRRYARGGHERASAFPWARELIELMSNALVDDLAKAGLVARCLRVDEAAPARGWLVRGIFTEVNEGNRLRRAAIGFGAGETRRGRSTSWTRRRRAARCPAP